MVHSIGSAASSATTAGRLGTVDFRSVYDQGFVRVAACTVPVRIADPAANAAAVLEQLQGCAADGVAVSLFPELCLTGYAIDDLLLQEPVLRAVQDAIGELTANSADIPGMFVVGAPLRYRNRLYNTAVAIGGGQVLGVVPKGYLPNYREFYERRHFAPGDDVRDALILAGDAWVPFGPRLLFAADDLPGLVVHVEVCEDMWVPVPPSAEAALAGATVLLNLSGSPITVARAEDRRLLVRSASSRCLAAYAYAAAGQGESSTDLSWDGQTMVYECGDLLGETERFPDGPRRTVVDVDLLRIGQDRMRQGTFDDNRRTLGPARRVSHRAVHCPTGRRNLRPAAVGRPVPVRPRRSGTPGAGLLRGLPHPGLRARTAPHRHRQSEGGDRCFGRPGLHPRADRRGQGDGSPGPAAVRHPRLHPPRFRDQHRHQGQRNPAVPCVGRDVRGDRHPAGRPAIAHRPRPSVRRRPADVRRDVRERPGRVAYRLPVPAGEPPRRHRAGHGRSSGWRSAGAPTAWATRCRIQDQRGVPRRSSST